MSDDQTLIEPHGNPGRDEERSAARTIIEHNVASPGPGRVVNLVPGADFRGYRLIEPVKVSSAEADLWLVEPRDKQGRFLLKLYRYGIAPKGEITEALHRLRREHVVEIIETGEWDGRHFEI